MSSASSLRCAVPAGSLFFPRRCFEDLSFHSCEHIFISFCSTMSLSPENRGGDREFMLNLEITHSSEEKEACGVLPATCAFFATAQTSAVLRPLSGKYQLRSSLRASLCLLLFWIFDSFMSLCSCSPVVFSVLLSVLKCDAS